MKSEVIKRLKTSKQALNDLGAKRQSPAEQYQYLTEISMEFQRVVGDAVMSNYGRYSIFKDHKSLRLVTATVNRSEAMSTMFAQYGHTYRFEGHTTNEQVPEGDASSDVDIDGEVVAEMNNAATSPPSDEFEVSAEPPDQHSTISVRQFLHRTDVDDLLPATMTITKPRRGQIFNWLRGIYQESRGFEIGTVNPTLLALVMKEQSHKWEDIALGYVADLIVLTHSFVNDLLHEVCPVRRVRDGILSLLMDQLCERYKVAIKQVKFLLSVDLDGTPSTLNHYFNDNLQKWYSRS